VAGALSLFLTLLGACAGTPAGAPDAPDTSPPLESPGTDAPATTSEFIAKVGDTVWYRIVERHERSFGASARGTPCRSEVNTLLAATLTARDDAADLYRVRIGRVWGCVEDSIGRLDFDTEPGVPRVFCRLDDVQADIALAGREIALRLAADGSQGPADASRMKTMLDLGALHAAASISCDHVRAGCAAEPGRSWDSSRTVPVGGKSLSLRTTTTVRAADDDTIDLEQSIVTATAGGATPDAGAQGRGGLKSRTTTTLRVSRRDGLVLRSDMAHESDVQLGGPGETMRHVIRTLVERVAAP